MPLSRHVATSFLTGERGTEPDPSARPQHYSFPLSSFDQNTAIRLAIMASKREGLETTGTDRYEHSDSVISLDT